MMKKLLIYFFLIAFVGLNLLTGFCLASQKHACCPTKGVKCPMQSMQKASSPEVSAKAVKCPYLKTLHNPKPVKSSLVKPVAHSNVPELFLPNYHLSASIAHQTNAPPQG